MYNIIKASKLLINDKQEYEVVKNNSSFLNHYVLPLSAHVITNLAV